MKRNDTDNQLSLPSAETIQKEIKREKYKQRYKRVLKSTVYALIVVAAVAVLIATLVLPVVQIAGNSMAPTLNEGEIVVLVKSKELEVGDLCAFSFSNKVLIKRVVGLPGDIIEMDAEGNVYVNSELLDEPYVVNKALGECDLEFPYQVPESQYFLLGDQRDTSIDSRSSVIGCVTKDQLIGKLIFRIWPFADIKWMA